MTGGSSGQSRKEEDEKFRWGGKKEGSLLEDWALTCVRRRYPFATKRKKRPVGGKGGSNEHR